MSNIVERLRALAERCEREEPSRELDREIAIATGSAWRDVRHGSYSPPLFTDSLDAAVALVPPEFADHWGAAQAGKDCIAHVGNQENEGPAKTPTLALCAAALRARAASHK